VRNTLTGTQAVSLRCNRVPTYIDRYPAKMVSRLADQLIANYASSCAHLLDPFCGSGAILVAARARGIPVSGADINPYAVLMSRVKTEGFSRKPGEDLSAGYIKRAACFGDGFPIAWPAARYWFTSATLKKYERLRRVAVEMDLASSPEGRAILLAVALSVRLCSRADQRSPKPFISKLAIRQRRGRHFDPLGETSRLFKKLTDLYGAPSRLHSKVVRFDLAADVAAENVLGRFSHIITSPPYINAQDYFRNFKLELHVLEGVLPFTVSSVKNRFIGTERGCLGGRLSRQDVHLYRELLPDLVRMESTHPRHALVVMRYLSDMSRCCDALKRCLLPGGVLVIVCGDNLVGGYSVPTWQLVDTLLQARGLVIFDMFGDPIDCRMLPPKRKGHKGLIKQEVVSAFRLPQ